MNKISFMPFQKMGIENIGTSLDCIEMPIAYIASKYKTENFYYYIIASYMNRMWDTVSDGNFTQNTNFILHDLGLHMKPVAFSCREELFDIFKNSVDAGNPLLLLVDYYTLFYEETHYQKDHIPHGVVLSGYSEMQETFLFQESAHMRFTALYPLPLTYDMVFEIISQSSPLFESFTYFEGQLYAIQPVSGNGMLPLDFFRKYLTQIKNGCNSLTRELSCFDTSRLQTSQGLAGFRRRFGSSHKVFFDFLERILQAEDITITDRYRDVKNSFLTFYDTFTAKIIKQFLKREETPAEQLLHAMEKIKELDVSLYAALTDMIKDKQSYINFALTGKFTASSESTFMDRRFPVENLIDGVMDSNGKYRMWSNAEWDKEPWIIIELPQKPQIVKATMFHANYSPVCSYVIEGSYDRKKWITLKETENNAREVTTDYIEGAFYRFYRFRFTKPSPADTAARLHKIELWGLLSRTDAASGALF